MPIRRRTGVRSVVFGTVIAVAAYVLFCIPAPPACAGPEIQPASYGYFDFPTCVRYALVHSNEFMKNRLEIQIRSVDVKDAHSEVLPTVQVLTRYYLTRATNSGQSSNRLNVQMAMTNWNPYVALLKIKGNEILVDIGKTAHLEKISENTGSMAKLFYRIHILEKMLRARREVAALHTSKVNYGKSRCDQGSMEQLELQVWTNKLKSEQLKTRSLEKELAEKTALLKGLMNYDPDFQLPLDTRDATNQVLNGFNGRGVNFANVQGQNLKLLMAAKKEQFQSNMVTGSYVALLPKPLLLLENIQNEVDRTSGFNLALGLDYTLWDGFKRVREVKRQKLKAQQLQLDRQELSQSLYREFQKLHSEVGISGEKEGFSREQAKLAELMEERSLLQYKSGAVPYEEYLQRRIEKVEANLDALNSVQDRVLALIDLAVIAGGLDKYNARIRY
jgi:outer membrane protein